MLYFIVAWAVLGAVCYVVGTAALTALRASSFSRLGDRAIVAIWLGLVIFAVSLQATSLVLPLSPLVGGAVAVGLVASSLRSPHNRNHLATLWHRLTHGWLLLATGITIVAAALMSQQVKWLDTGLYHYSSIQWLANYGAVPGVALLFSHFGFTSSWFALAAPLNPSVLDDRAAAVANGFIFLVASVSLVVCLRQCTRNNARLSDWFLACYLLIMLPLTLRYSLLAVILVSASPDLPVVLLVGITAWTMLITLQDSPQPSLSSYAHAVPMILAAGAMTMKLVAIPLMGIGALFYMVQGGLTWRRSLLGAGGLLLLLTPLVTSSVITSGCPLFPSTLLCLDLPWSPTRDVVTSLANSTHNVTSWYSKGTVPAGIHPWLWAMWLWLSKERINQLIVGTSISALLAIFYIVRQFKLQQVRPYFWLLGTALSALIFLLLTSPMARFTLPYIVLIVALLLATIAHHWLGNHLPERFQHMADVASSKIGRLHGVSALAIGTLTLIVCISASSRLLLPLPMKQNPVVQKTMNDITYWSPKYLNNDRKGLCWSAPLPCAFYVEPDVWLRQPNRGIAGGFVRKSTF